MRSGSLDVVSDATNENPDQSQPSLAHRFLKPKQEKDYSDTYADGIIPPEQRKAAMQTLNRVEVRVGYLAAAFAALMGGLATLIFPRQRLLTQKPVHGTCPTNYTLSPKGVCEAYASNQLVTLAIITMVFAVAIFVAVRMRRRTPATFASLITGVAFTSFSISVGAPFLIFGGWLFLRARRIQKYGTTDAKQTAVQAGEARAARRAGQTPAQTREARAAARSAKAETPKTSPRADVTKRYTPPAPKRKKVAPPVKDEKPSKWRARLEGLDEEG